LEPLTADGWNPVKQWRAPKGGEGGGRYVEMPDIKAVIRKVPGIQRRILTEEHAKKTQEYKKAGKRPPVKPKALRDLEAGTLPPAKPKGNPAFTPEGKAAYDQPKRGYRQANEQELRDFGDGYAGLLLPDDDNDDDDAKAIAFKPDGSSQRIYSVEHHLTQERAKWARVDRLLAHSDRIDSQLRQLMNDKNPRVADRAKALMMSYLTGMRPGSEDQESILRDEKGKAILDKNGKEQRARTYGATTLLAKHVARQNSDGSVTMDFIGKSGVRNQIRVNDPEMAAELMRLKKEKGPNEQLFPYAKEGAVGAMLKRIAGDEFKTKDLRTMWANAMVAEYMEKMVTKTGRGPKSEAEFVRWMEAATEHASSRLGNQHETFKKNYLSAVPFLDLMPENWEDYWRWGAKMH